MSICIMTDSNSGITQEEGKQLGIPVVPMPFTINGKDYLEDINLGQEEFYNLLDEKAVVLTSQPSAGDLMDMWKKELKTNEAIVYIPMSSGLSKSCETAKFLSQENIHLIVSDNSKLYTFTLDNMYIIELVNDMNNPFNASNL